MCCFQLYSLKRKLTRRRRGAPDHVITEEPWVNCHDVPDIEHVTQMASVYMCPKCDIVCAERDGEGDIWCLDTTQTSPNCRQLSNGGDCARTDCQVLLHVNGDACPSETPTAAAEIATLHPFDKFDNVDTTLKITDGSPVYNTNNASVKDARSTFFQPGGDDRVYNTESCASCEARRPELTSDTPGESPVAGDIVCAGLRVPTSSCMKREPGTKSDPLVTSSPLSSGVEDGVGNCRPCGDGITESVSPTVEGKRHGEMRDDTSCKSHPGMLCGVCVCVCVCACVRVCVRACVRACVRVCGDNSGCGDIKTCIILTLLGFTLLITLK